MKPGVHLRDEDLLGPLLREQEEHLRACASCAGRASNQEQIRAAVRGMAREAPVPVAAATLLTEAAASSRLLRRWVALLAAVTISVAVAVVWATHRPRGPLPAPLVDELALDHLHYERKVEAAQVKGDEASISAWFAGKLGFSPHLGSIEATTVEGAKPCRIAGQWTALVWLDRAGHWLSLFTMPQQTADRRGCASAQGVRVCASPDPRGGARVLVGDLPEGEMLRLVDESLE